MTETEHGRLIGLTARNWFHLEHLYLNRLQLIEMRCRRRVLRAQDETLSRARETEAHLRRANDTLQKEISELRATVALLRHRGT